MSFNRIENRQANRNGKESQYYHQTNGENTVMHDGQYRPSSSLKTEMWLSSKLYLPTNTVVINVGSVTRSFPIPIIIFIPQMHTAMMMKRQCTVEMGGLLTIYMEQGRDIGYLQQHIDWQMSARVNGVEAQMKCQQKFIQQQTTENMRGVVGQFVQLLLQRGSGQQNVNRNENKYMRTIKEWEKTQEKIKIEDTKDEDEAFFNKFFSKNSTQIFFGNSLTEVGEVGHDTDCRNNETQQAGLHRYNVLTHH